MEKPTKKAGPDKPSLSEKTRKSSHKIQILEYLESGGRLTFFKSARLFRCRALIQRVSELRAQGHPIKKIMIETPDGARIAEYFLDKDSQS